MFQILVHCNEVVQNHPMNTGRGILVYKLKSVTYLIQLIKKPIQNSINIETAEKK